MSFKIIRGNAQHSIYIADSSCLFFVEVDCISLPRINGNGGLVVNQQETLKRAHSYAQNVCDMLNNDKRTDLTDEIIKNLYDREFFVEESVFNKNKIKNNS